MKLAAIAIGIAITGAVVSAAILGSSMVCACEPQGYAVMSALRTNPMKDDPAVSSAAFFAKIPRGSPLAEVREVIGAERYEKYCKESSGGESATCAFDMAEGYLGQFRKGFEFEMKLSKARRIEDVRFQTYKRAK